MHHAPLTVTHPTATTIQLSLLPPFNRHSYPQADVVAHLVVVAGLLHQHFHIGVHIAHSLLHTLESWGLLIAVVSTLAAAAAEVLAMRAGAPHAAPLHGGHAGEIGGVGSDAPSLVMGGAAEEAVAALRAKAQQALELDGRHEGHGKGGESAPQPI